MRAATPAAILAFCATCAVAAPIKEASLDDLTAELCKTLSFPAVVPPTPAAQKCKELLGEVDDLPKLPHITRGEVDLDHLTKETCEKLKLVDDLFTSPIRTKCKEILEEATKDLPELSDIQPREEDLSHLTAEICKTMAFPMIFPPTPAQEKCEELINDAEKDLPDLPAVTRDEDLRHLTADICKNLAFPAVMPPSPAEVKCRELLKEAGDDLLTLHTREVDVSDLTPKVCKTLDLAGPAELPKVVKEKCEELLDIKTPVLSRREEQNKEDGLKHLTAELCRTLSFPAVLPPTAAELKCRELLGEEDFVSL